VNILLDIGNTKVKAALYHQNSLLELKTVKTPTDLLQELDFLKKAEQCFVCTVVDGLEDFYSQLTNYIPTSIFTSQTPLPIQNKYQSLATLGSDRIAASVGAFYLYPNNNVLVIDCGTCIKYNFTNSQNDYLGGAISPGLQMRFKALNHFTSKLPLINYEKINYDLVGTNTHASMLSGVINGAVAEINGLISNYKQHYSNLICVLTGGDSEYLAKQLKNSIFVHQNLVLKGLNDILNYTLDNK